MKIKIVQHVPTKPSPEIGKVYEVTKTNEPTNKRYIQCIKRKE